MFQEHPYINVHLISLRCDLCFQCYNLLQFCELAVKNCPNIKRINLMTTYADRPQNANRSHREKQEANLEQLRTSLKQNKITFNVTYSNTLHDREIV